MAITKVTSGLISADASSIDLNIDAGTLYLDVSENRVGIGTTSPSTALEVNNASAGATVATFEGSYNASGDVKLASFERNGGAVAAAITYADATTAMEFGTTTSHSLILTTGDTERMRIDASGTVKMSVNGSVASLILENDADKPYMSFTESGSAKFYIGESAGVGGGDGFYDLYATSGLGQRFFTGAAERMRIDSSGNVGIGETAPQNLLHVKASDTGIAPHASAQIVLEREGTNYLQFLTAETGTSGILFGDGSDVDVSKITVDHSTTKMTFTNETIDTMTLNGANVGIGSSDPTGDALATADDLVIKNAGSAGLTIKSIDAGNQTIAFGSSSDEDYALIQGYYNSGSPFVRHSISGSEKMRLNSNGTLMVGGTTNPTYAHRIFATGNGITNGTVRFDDDDVSCGLANVIMNLSFSQDNDCTSASFVYMTDSGGAIGSITAASGTSVSFNTTSDERLKKNIVDASSQLDTIKNIKIREFDWKKNDYHEVGVIAQEIIDVVPNAVQEGGDDVTKHPFGVDYGKIVPYLIKAVQEQQTIIDDLKTRIETLENA